MVQTVQIRLRTPLHHLFYCGVLSYLTMEAPYHTTGSAFRDTVYQLIELDQTVIPNAFSGCIK